MDDVKKCGYLRKQKSMRKRYFVLRSPGDRGPARLEYYENEKKFRLADGGGGPRGAVLLEEAFGVNKRADAKRRHLLVLYTRDAGLCVSMEGEEEQEAWYQAIVELQAQVRCLSLPSAEGATGPGPAFREVWQVSLRPRGLGQTRNLSGVYRLCLTDRTLSLLRLRSDTPSVTLQLMNVRRCGHSDNYFFVEVGRSAVTGPGELWMQVEDSVVAQNMHETILEAMKSLSEEFRPRTKSQSLSSTPITVPSRRHLPNPPPPSQVGLSRRSRADAMVDSSPVTKPHSLPRDHSPRSPEEDEEKRPHMEAHQPSVDYGSASSDEYGSSPSLFEPPPFLPPSPVSGETNYISMGQLGRRSQVLDLVSSFVGPSEDEDRKLAKVDHEDNYAIMAKCERPEATGYMPMLPGTRSQDYMPMTPNSISPPAPIEMAGYVMMSPLGSCSPDPERTSWPPSGEMSIGSADSQASDYMNMWPLSRSASSTPPPPDNPLSSLRGPTRIPSSYRSLPRSYKIDPVPPSLNSCSSSSDSLEEASGGRYRRPLSVSVDTWRTSTLPGSYRRPPSPGEYVSIHFRGKPEKSNKKRVDNPQAEYIAMDTQNHPVTNGDYTKMKFEPETLGSQVKMSAGHMLEKAPKATKENVFARQSSTEPILRPSTEPVPWSLPSIEKPPKTSGEEGFWPVAATDKVFRPIAPAEAASANGTKVPGEVLAESLLAHHAVRPGSEDLELRGLLAAVTGCNLTIGLQDRAKFTRIDHSVKMKNATDSLSSASSAGSCNGNRAPIEEPGLNYIDLDLAKDAAVIPPIPALVGPVVAQPVKTANVGANPCINTYASIDFQMSGELRRSSRDGTEC